MLNYRFGIHLDKKDLEPLHNPIIEVLMESLLYMMLQIENPLKNSQNIWRMFKNLQEVMMCKRY
jgi:hypothetical protein